MTAELTDAVKDELIRRREEYTQHPERFVVIHNAAELDGFFAGIRKEVQKRVNRSRH
ncbi:MAG TPA: hypothetical protein VGH19_21740 [Verrucomicrobiae bacterium]